jgi:acyl-CoA synthetase (NDP forming)
VKDLRPLLEPTSVAVLGASTDPAKPGSVLLRNIREGGFEGRVYAINPKADSIQGAPAHPSIGAVPEAVDLAFIVLRRELVHQALAECVAAGTRAVAIITAGFGEADEWGKQEQEKLAATIADANLLVIGPNTIGLVTMGGRHRGSFVQFPEWEDGPIGLVAQSGVFAGAVADDVMSQRRQRLGVHATIGIGNRVGVTEYDLLEALAANDNVGVLGFHLESFSDARGFLARAAEVKRHKPIVVLKSGRTPTGARAAASHTGALAADDAVVEQILAQHGIVRALDDEEFVALLKSFSYTATPAGNRLGVVTFSGAMGVVATDLATLDGLEVPAYSPDTVARIGRLLPEWQGVGNPADLWPAIDLGPRDALVEGLQAALADPGVDQVLGILLAVPNADFEGIAHAFAGVVAGAEGKPLHLVIVGSLREAWTDGLEGLRVPVHASVRLAVRSLAAAAWYAGARERVPEAALVATATPSDGGNFA